MTRYPATYAASLLLGTVLGGVLGKPWGVEAMSDTTVEQPVARLALDQEDAGSNPAGRTEDGDTYCETSEPEPMLEPSQAAQQSTPGGRRPLQPWNDGAAGLGLDAHDSTLAREQGSNPVAVVPSVLKWIKTTAYCPGECCCEGSADGITATGVQVARQPYGGASAWDRLQPGTRFKAPGYDPGHTGGWYEIDDSGSAMRRSSRRGVTHLDLRFRTHYWAKKWGTRWLWVEVRP